jgi:hypothetical protein
VHEHQHLQIMIERMQRDGVPERAIHDAVRQARRPDRGEPDRRPFRFRLFRRRRRG